MKFVAKKEFNNSPMLGITITPSTPGFKHESLIPKGFRFEVTDEFKIQKVKEGQVAIIDDDSTKSRVEIKKIEAEVKEEERIRKLAVDKQSAERAAETASNRPHKYWYERPAGLIGIGVLIAVVGGVAVYVLCEYLKKKFFHS